MRRRILAGEPGRKPTTATTTTGWPRSRAPRACPSNRPSRASPPARRPRAAGSGGMVARPAERHGAAEALLRAVRVGALRFPGVEERGQRRTSAVPHLHEPQPVPVGDEEVARRAVGGQLLPPRLAVVLVLEAAPVDGRLHLVPFEVEPALRGNAAVAHEDRGEQLPVLGHGHAGRDAAGLEEARLSSQRPVHVGVEEEQRLLDVQVERERHGVRAGAVRRPAGGSRGSARRRRAPRNRRCARGRRGWRGR